MKQPPVVADLDAVSNVDAPIVGWELVPVDTPVFSGQECPIYAFCDRALMIVVGFVGFGDKQFEVDLIRFALTFVDLFHFGLQRRRAVVGIDRWDAFTVIVSGEGQILGDDHLLNDYLMHSFKRTIVWLEGRQRIRAICFDLATRNDTVSGTELDQPNLHRRSIFKRDLASNWIGRWTGRAAATDCDCDQQKQNAKAKHRDPSQTD
jgi:hypothetical protein